MTRPPATTTRHGATAVEFALVAPVVLLLFFSAIETARLMMADGSVTSAALVGMREASLVDATPAGVEQVIRDELSVSGISHASVAFDPSLFGPNDLSLTISVRAPLDSTNGFIGSSLIAPGSSVSKSIRFLRENN